MPAGPGDPATITLDRTEFARVLGCWAEFGLRLARQVAELERGAPGAGRTLRAAALAFERAVGTETRQPFLLEHAEEFAQIIRKVALQPPAERVEERARRRERRKPRE